MPDTAVEPIESVLSRYTIADKDGLLKALTDREDAIVGFMVGAGAQFGMFPEIVAEVVAAIGVGTPISDEERLLIHQQFRALMQRLHDEQNNQG